MTSCRKATQKELRVLSQKLLRLLEDKTSQIYKENVTKFGIPEEYVKEAFAETTLIEATTNGKAEFYLALKNNGILGFAQTIQRSAETAELDRIIIFPQHARKGIGTKLLKEVLANQKKRGIRDIVVNAGEKETHARRFYERNGFKKIEETTIDAPWGTKLTLVTYQLHLK